MNAYKNIVFSVLTLLPIYTAIPAELKSLSDMYEKTPDRLIADISETEYLVHRCAALYTAIGAVYTNDGKNYADERSRESARLGHDLMQRADAYITISLKLASKTGRTESSVIDRLRLLTDEYSRIFDRNRELTNDGTSGLIGADLETCKDIGKFARNIVKKR
jgi:hypothetical protein